MTKDRATGTVRPEPDTSRQENYHYLERYVQNLPFKFNRETNISAYICNDCRQAKSRSGLSARMYLCPADCCRATPGVPNTLARNVWKCTVRAIPAVRLQIPRNPTQWRYLQDVSSLPDGQLWRRHLRKGKEMRNPMLFVSRTVSARPLTFAGGLLGAFYAGWLAQGPAAAEQPKMLPVPAHDVIDQAPLQTAVFAGGCFWGTQGVFQRVNGVVSTKAGYAGGTAETATYERTETGTTDHAEAVQIVYDSRKISYGKLLQVFFSVAHDPTQLNRQGADVGPQYRSAIFSQTADQAKVAKSYIEQLDAAGSFDSKIETTIEPGKAFFTAETFHQDYLIHNPTEPYIAFVEQPRVDALREFFPSLWRNQPVLATDHGG